MPSRNFLARKLTSGISLGDAELARLGKVTQSGRAIAAGQDMIREGDDPVYVHIIRSGAACRYKTLPDGRRAIVALLLPGDFCDLHVQILSHMDHTIGALTDCEVTRIKGSELDEMLSEFPQLNRAFIWATLVDEAILREWVVNIGRRRTDRQLAHLFCELYTRMNAIGLTEGGTFRMPFTHGTLGDLLGISEVHIQRTMTGLREDGLISLQDRAIRFPDFAALAELGEFDPGYLHLR